MDNLTRQEARARTALITRTSYQIDLDLTGDDKTFRSLTILHFTCREPGATTFVNLAAASVTDMTLNGIPICARAFDPGLARLTLEHLATENVLVVDASCRYSRTGTGLHRFTDPADGRTYLYTDLETFDAHRVFACFDQPDIKASFEFAVTAPKGWAVVSNMAARSSDPVPEARDDAARRWRFDATPPISTYIAHVSAGPYYVVRDEHDGIPLGIYCRQSLAAHLDPDEIFTVTKQGFDFFHGTFGIKYPFGKYDQLFVPEFKEAAMENAGAVTFSEQFVFRSRVTDFVRQSRAVTIMHEMAHMWFGNLVTMRWWDDLWLSESFATWAGTLAVAEATRWSASWTTFAQAYKAWAYRQDQLPSSHPIVADIDDIEAVEANFDGITYDKGAAVLKQLVAWSGPDNFLAGLREYFAAHAWGSATLHDLLNALEDKAGRRMAGWSKQWLETAGVNTLRAVFAVDEADRFTSFAIIQEASRDHPVLRPHRLAIGFYDRIDGELRRAHRIEVDVAGQRTELPGLAGMPRPALVLVNDDDLSYTKVRLDSRSLSVLMSSIGSLTDPLAAALCWSAAWDMCRDGELAARSYLRLVLSGISSVTDLSMAQALLIQAGGALRRYADPAWRPIGMSAMASSLRSLLADAAPGSDIQLVYVTAFASVATSSSDLLFLAGLLDGTAPLPGLDVDSELRWMLLNRLVSRGALGCDAIDAELARDFTDAGQRYAATCRAAIPTAAAKYAAWQQLVGGNLSVALFRAVLAGFADSDQRELTEPYLDDYLTATGSVWQDLPSVMAQDFVSGLYPICPFDQRTVGATDAYIAATSPPAVLCRLLIEGRADVLRTMTARACDSEEANPCA
jgi:aminopeptidase N